MKRNILLLVPLLAALPLFAAEDMQFTTVLSYYSEDQLASFATLETVDPTQPAEISGNGLFPAQVRFCNVNSTGGTITLSGTPNDPENNRPVQVGEDHSSGITFSGENTGQLQSETAGEVQVKYDVVMSGSSSITGKQLLADAIAFRGEKGPLIGPYPSSLKKTATVKVTDTLLIAPQSGTPHLQTVEATIGNLTVIHAADTNKFSTMTGGTAHLSSTGTTWGQLPAITNLTIPYIKVN